MLSDFILVVWSLNQADKWDLGTKPLQLSLTNHLGLLNLSNIQDFVILLYCYNNQHFIN